jgi:hypothetical protein
MTANEMIEALRRLPNPEAEVCVLIDIGSGNDVARWVTHVGTLAEIVDEKPVGTISIGCRFT